MGMVDAFTKKYGKCFSEGGSTSEGADGKAKSLADYKKGGSTTCEKAMMKGKKSFSNGGTPSFINTQK